VLSAQLQQKELRFRKKRIPAFSIPLLQQRSFFRADPARLGMMKNAYLEKGAVVVSEVMQRPNRIPVDRGE